MDLGNIAKAKILTSEHMSITSMLRLFDLGECSITIQIETAVWGDCGVQWMEGHAITPLIKKMLEHRKLAIEKELETL